MFNIKNKIEKSIKQRGVAGTMKMSLFNLYYYGKKLAPWALYAAYKERDFDRRYGVDTSGRIDLSDLGDVEGIAAELGTRYEPISPDAFHAVMAEVKRVGIDPSELTFIDYGSGKGRTLLLASDYPFRRIIGIEISRKLHEVAERNIQLYESPRQRCSAIASHAADALAWEPPNEPTLFYFYHPFEGPLLSQVLARIQASLERNPRKAWVLYVGPMYDEVMEGAKFLEERTRSRVPPLHGIYACQVLVENAA